MWRQLPRLSVERSEPAVPVHTRASESVTFCRIRHL